ncbi:MAG: alpha-ketoglutarate-dependent dioxygenase AlkB [Rhodospirillaceae bacterium]|nr:MAG: alpha-ketoglutarate-dependent dioxygenase AlkB [Rhodospirillaceae bacterium]
MADLFAHDSQSTEGFLPAGVSYRPGLVDAATQTVLARAVADIAARAPFRHPRTPGRGAFSAAITNCGTVGWWSDQRGYRYVPAQPESALPWPEIPQAFRDTVARVMAGTPWPRFAPDACLINFYGPGAKMGLHQDRDERDFAQPIVTVSLGDTADFMVGGGVRSDKTQAFQFRSGDVLIMGGEGRMLFHGVRRVHEGTSPITGLQGRYSLTFRKAL